MSKLISSIHDAHSRMIVIRKCVHCYLLVGTLAKNRQIKMLNDPDESQNKTAVSCSSSMHKIYPRVLCARVQSESKLLFW